MTLDTTRPTYYTCPDCRSAWASSNAYSKVCIQGHSFRRTDDGQLIVPDPPAVSRNGHAPAPIDTMDLPRPAGGADIARIPELPTFAALKETETAQAAAARSVWLDPFIDSAARMSPRTPRALLEACGLFALMLAIARRCYVMTGARAVYPAVYLLFVGRSTIRAKTTGLETLRSLLKIVGLADLLLPSRFSAQALAADLALWVHESVRSGSPEQQAEWLSRHRHAAARGIIRDEVAGLFDDVTKDYNSGLLPLLLELDGAPDLVDPGLTISRGQQEIRNACVPLLGATTPAALREHAAQAYHWRNGMFGRWAIIAADEAPRWSFWQNGAGFEPAVWVGLKRLYEAFAQPVIEFQYGEAEPSAKGEPRPPKIVGAVQQGYVAIQATFAPDAWGAYSRYDHALFELASRPDHPERMDPTYGRLSGLAVRLALALACCEWAHGKREGAPVLELRHWCAAQEIVERWRGDAHRILSAALDVDAQEAGAADVTALIEHLTATQPAKRGDVLRALNWTAARLTLAVTGSGGRVVESTDKATGGRPSIILTLALPDEETKGTKLQVTGRRDGFDSFSSFIGGGHVDMDALGEELLGRVAASDWGIVRLPDGRAIGPGESAWAMFINTAPEADVRLAHAALRRGEESN